MEYEKIVCNVMSNYTLIKASIINTKYVLNNELKDNGSLPECDGKVIRNSNAITSDEDDRILNYDRLKKQLAENENLLKRLDNCIESLPFKHKTIIERKYIDGHSWKEIAEEVDYSVSHCKRLHNRALYEITIALYGCSAIK